MHFCCREDGGIIDALLESYMSHQLEALLLTVSVIPKKSFLVYNNLMPVLK